MIIIMVAATLYSEWSYGILLLVMMAGMLHEHFKLSALCGAAPQKPMAFAVSIALLLFAFIASTMTGGRASVVFPIPSLRTERPGCFSCHTLVLLATSGKRYPDDSLMKYSLHLAIRSCPPSHRSPSCPRSPEGLPSSPRSPYRRAEGGISRSRARGGPWPSLWVSDSSHRNMP